MKLNPKLKELIKGKITHQEIADELGLAREAVTCILNGKETTEKTGKLIGTYIWVRLYLGSKVHLYFLSEKLAEEIGVENQRVYEVSKFSK